ncbi:NACHT domain-containing protein [Enterobacter roggenkampii]|uniref:NACHT domain-containing protein n=1 Tax=Enterobacter roggenkampii TaxID=1812935 RepID=UPI003525A897
MTSFVELSLPILIKSIVTGLISIGGEELKKKKNNILLSFSSDRIVDKYINNSINKVFVFRTLLHGDRNVYLHDVYYPLNIRNTSNNSIVLVEDNTILPAHSPICIVGIAGQGKTTIMRKLFLEELSIKNKFPVFISLRQVEDFHKLSCAQLLLDHLNSKGVEGTIEDARYLCEKGMISFFFDGFDEIPFNQRINALNTIGEAHEKYGCKVIVTTRPDTEITRVAGYDIYNVEYLKQEMLYSVINNTVEDVDTAANLKDTLEKKQFIRESIKTPILLDIFIVTSRNFTNDPKSITDYYSGLFSALLYRHDLIKNLTREKKSGLVDRELEKCFSLFSFLSYFNNVNDFTRNNLLAFFEKSIKANKVASTAEKVADDIVDGTNLIVKDGYDHFVYIHRSIQEYFSAKFIATMKKDMKKSIYDKLVQKDADYENTNLLVMSSYLDPFCFSELYIINRLLSIDIFEDDKIKIIPYDSYRASVLEWFLIYEDIDGNYSCDSMISGGGKIWNNISLIYSINSIITNGENRNYSSAFAETFMMKYASRIQRKLMSGDLIPDYNTEVIKDIYSSKEDREHKFIIKFSSIFPFIQESETITKKSYRKYLSRVDNINKFLTENYFNKIEGDGILGELVNDLGFD